MTAALWSHKCGWGRQRTFTIELPHNGDGVRTRKTVGGYTTQYVLDLATTLPVVISDEG